MVLGCVMFSSGCCSGLAFGVVRYLGLVLVRWFGWDCVVWWGLVVRVLGMWKPGELLYWWGVVDVGCWFADGVCDRAWPLLWLFGRVAAGRLALRWVASCEGTSAR